MYVVCEGRTNWAAVYWRGGEPINREQTCKEFVVGCKLMERPLVRDGWRDDLNPLDKLAKGCREFFLRIFIMIPLVMANLGRVELQYFDLQPSFLAVTQGGRKMGEEDTE